MDYKPRSAAVPASSVARFDCWPAVEVRHLAALLAVVEQRSFHAAALTLGYTQPAISQQIATLERIVGARLLDRAGKRRGVALTDAGRVIAHHGRMVMAQFAAARADLRAITERQAARLRIGATPIVGPQVLGGALYLLGTSSPSSETEVIESMNDGELLAMLEAGQLDACFAELPLPDGPFDSIAVVDEPFVLVAPARSGLGRRAAPVSLGELAELPLLCSARSRSTERALRALREAGHAIAVVCRSDVAETLHALVAGGVGNAFVPYSAARMRDDRTAVLTIADPLPRFRVGLVWNTNVQRSELVDSLLEAVRAQAGAQARRAALEASG